MDQTISSNAARLAIVNLMVATADVLSAITLRLFKNALTFNNQTVLSDLQEATFPNYASVLNQTGSAAYIDPTGTVRSELPDHVFVTTAGISQVETQTVIGTITLAGTVVTIVTAAGMTGSPKTVTTNVLLGDNAAAVAAKIRASLNADADVAPFFNVGGSGADVVLTRKATAANDSTMNIDIDNGTATGLTDTPTSVHTRAGSTTGGTIDETIYGWYYTTADGTTLLLGNTFDTPVPLSSPAQGVLVDPSYSYGS